MSISLEHNGRELTFSEHDESWSCYAMNMRATSLKALKAKLDKFDGQARKVNVPVLIVGLHDDAVKRAEIVMIAKPKDWDVADYKSMAKTPSVWVVSVSGNQTKREKVRLDRCVPVSAEVRETIEAARAKFEESKRLRAEGVSLIAGLPRLSIEELTAKSVTEDEDA